MGERSKGQGKYASHWICHHDGYDRLIHYVSRTRLSKLGFDPAKCIKIDKDKYDYINESSVDKKITN